MDGPEAVGAIDFQSEQPFAFALDDVAAGETLAEFLVVALSQRAAVPGGRRRSDPWPTSSRGADRLALEHRRRSGRRAGP